VLSILDELYAKLVYPYDTGIRRTLEQKLCEIGNEKKCPIALMMRNGEILCGNRHYTPDKWKKISVWTIPGGRCDLGETLEQALQREVFEEVGIDKFEIVEFIGEVLGAKDGDVVPIFFCTTEQDAKLMEPEKFSEWKWVTKKEYLENSEYSGFNPAARKLILEFLQGRS
jgi:8-oxo-dGTP pyrophosphatase MutT (NUDIX family)